MTKLTDKQRRRWGAMMNVLYESRPLALKEIFKAKEAFQSDGHENFEMLDLDGWEYEEDEDGNWTYDPDD